MIRDIGRDPDKQDLPNIGGSKTKVLPQISPFIATNVSDSSIEDLRLSVEKQLREIADVTRNILILMDALDARITKLEPNP